MTAVTVREAIKSPSPAIGFFYQDSPAKAKALVTVLITDLVKFFNVGKTMNDFQVGQTVNLIFEDNQMRCMKPDDFKVCFTNMKKGHYGKSYDRIDGQIILDIITQYLEERQSECEQISIDAHKEREKNEKGELNPEGVKKVVEILKAAVAETGHVKIEEPVKLEKKPIVKSERDIFIQNCFNEFYKIWLNNPYKPDPVKPMQGLSVNNSPAGRYILFEDRPVDEVEYAKIKVKEFDNSLSNLE